MKKRIALLVAFVLIAGVFSGCAANMGAKDAYTTETAAVTPSAAMESYNESKAEADMPYETGEADGASLVGSTAVTKPVDLAEKIIYSASAELETVKFDETVDGISELVSFYDGFMESSYVSGASYREKYYGSQTYRWAEFVIRVPSRSFEGFKSDLEMYGNVIGVSTSADNITSQYYDVASRLTAYQTEERTLLAMLEKAENVSDMLEIERTLAEVRYNIESLQSTLKNWDNKVDYSTVTVRVQEVRELTEITEVHRSYWEEIRDGFLASLKSVGRFFKDLFAWFASNLPVIVLVVLIALAGLAVLRKLVRVDPEKRAARRLRREERKAARAAKRAARKQKKAMKQEEKGGEE